MFNTMFPELHVTDCEAAAQFFEKALGYHRGYTLMEGDHLDFAVMKHTDAESNLCLPAPRPWPDRHGRARRLKDRRSS